MPSYMTQKEIDKLLDTVGEMDIVSFPQFVFVEIIEDATYEILELTESTVIGKYPQVKIKDCSMRLISKLYKTLGKRMISIARTRERLVENLIEDLEYRKTFKNEDKFVENLLKNKG